MCLIMVDLSLPQKRHLEAFDSVFYSCHSHVLCYIQKRGVKKISQCFRLGNQFIPCCSKSLYDAWKLQKDVQLSIKKKYDHWRFTAPFIFQTYLILGIGIITTLQKRKLTIKKRLNSISKPGFTKLVDGGRAGLSTRLHRFLKYSQKAQREAPPGVLQPKPGGHILAFHTENAQGEGHGYMI